MAEPAPKKPRTEYPDDVWPSVRNQLGQFVLPFREAVPELDSPSRDVSADEARYSQKQFALHSAQKTALLELVALNQDLDTALKYVNMYWNDDDLYGLLI